MNSVACSPSLSGLMDHISGCKRTSSMVAKPWYALVLINQPCKLTYTGAIDLLSLITRLS